MRTSSPGLARLSGWFVRRLQLRDLAGTPAPPRVTTIRVEARRNKQASRRHLSRSTCCCCTGVEEGKAFGNASDLVSLKIIEEEEKTTLSSVNSFLPQSNETKNFSLIFPFFVLVFEEEEDDDSGAREYETVPRRPFCAGKRAAGGRISLQ